MLHFIINPIAGNGRARKTWEQVERWLQERGIEYQARFSEAPGHAAELARACAAQGLDKVFCVGGDGTNFEVINGLKGTHTALGLIPAGTGNDFVKVLHMPKDPLQVMAMLLDAPACPINVCTLNDGVFLNVCGAGFDVEVLRNTPKVAWMGRGMLPYLIGVIRTIIKHAHLRLRVVIDGEEREEDLLLIGIANGQYIGWGMRIAPMARLDDDLLDIILVKPLSRLRIVRMLPSFIKGTFLREADVVTHTRCREIALYPRQGEKLHLQADGLVQAMPYAKMAITAEHQLLLIPESLQKQAGIGAGK